MDRQIRECLPDIRAVARKSIQINYDPENPQVAIAQVEALSVTRTLCLEALGVIKHEDNLPVLLEVMRSLANLERARVPHGSSGDMDWTRFYIPARTSFCTISLSGIETADQAAAWLAKHRDFTVPQAPRVDPRETAPDRQKKR